MTTDGVQLSRVDTSIRVADPNAVDEGGSEIEMFFDTDADAGTLLDERWNWRKTRNRIHEAVEVETGFGLGTTVAVVPAVPRMTVQDDSRNLNQTVNIRAFAVDYTKERYSLELLG